MAARAAVREAMIESTWAGGNSGPFCMRSSLTPHSVIPAKAGIPLVPHTVLVVSGIPAFAGMTELGVEQGVNK